MLPGLPLYEMRDRGLAQVAPFVLYAQVLPTEGLDALRVALQCTGYSWPSKASLIARLRRQPLFLRAGFLGRVDRVRFILFLAIMVMLILLSVAESGRATGTRKPFNRGCSWEFAVWG